MRYLCYFVTGPNKTLKGIEAMNMIKKRQVNNLNSFILNEVKYINQLFGIVV